LIKHKLYPETILGIGTGSTVNFFIDELKSVKNNFAGAVSSSEASSILLKKNGIEVFDLNDVIEIAFYIDGADEVSPNNELIKGGGGAHTREKIVASASNEFICIVDESKIVSELGDFPLPVEVIPESRSLVARKILSIGGIPEYRSGFVTDQGNHILDVKDIDISNPESLEMMINNIPGVIDNGIFAANKPDIVLIPK
jgi:ribose 5-phosphate isomerase A